MRTGRLSGVSFRVFLYVLKDFVFSFFIAFLFFFVIFFINQLIVIFRDVISRQVDTLKALLLLVYSLPAIAALAFPFGSLVGSLLTVGRLSADNEVIALQSVGFGLKQIFVPILVGSLALSLFSFSMNNVFLPLGTIQYRALMEKLLFSNTELILEPYSVTKFNKTSIITDEVKAGNLTSILLFDASEAGSPRITTARSASLDKAFQDSGILTLKLEDVTMVEQGKAWNSIDRSDLDYMSYTLTVQDLTRSIRNPSPAEMSFIDISSRINDLSRDLEEKEKVDNEARQVLEVLFHQLYLRSLSDSSIGADQITAQYETVRNSSNKVIVDRNLQLHWIEFWKKLTIPLACTTLVILGFPLGLYARRSARGLGFGLGLVVAALYWGAIIAGQVIAMDNLELSATLLMWAPNALFLVVGGILFIPLVGK